MKASWYIAGTVIMTTSAPSTALAASLVAASGAKPVLPAVVSEPAVTSTPPRACGPSSFSASIGNSNSVTSMPLSALSAAIARPAPPAPHTVRRSEVPMCTLL